MGIRQFINKHQSVMVAAMLAVTAGAVAYGYHGIRPERLPPQPNRFYYVDEDKTRFEDCFAGPRDLIPPFDHNGKQAVRARVFDVNGTRTLVFVEKASPDLKKSLEKRKSEMASDPQGAASGMPVDVQMRMSAISMLLKRPGDKAWVRYIDKAAQAIARPPSGPDGMAVPEVLPDRE